jgi:hypothetical protein
LGARRKLLRRVCGQVEGFSRREHFGRPAGTSPTVGFCCAISSPTRRSARMLAMVVRIGQGDDYVAVEFPDRPRIH